MSEFLPLFFKFFYLIPSGACCWGLGRWIAEFILSKNYPIPGLAIHLLSFVIGNVVFSYLLTILGFLGLFRPAILWLVLLASIFLVIFQIVKNIISKMVFIPENRSPANSSKNIQQEKNKFILILGFLLIGLFLIPAILQSIAPPYMRDSLVYHLLCPKEYLKAGRLIHIEGNLYSAFPKGHEVIITFLLSIAGDRAAQGFSILQNIAAIISLFLIVRLIANSSSALICTLGYATIPPTIYFSGCGYVEPALVMVLGSSLLALFVFLNDRAKISNSNKLTAKEYALIGFLAGWMPAIKYTGLIYLGLLGLLILWSQRKESVKETLKGIGFFTLAAAPGFSWMVWNWIELGNPVYPFAYSFFGGKEWDEVRDRAMYLYFQMFGMGKEIGDYILLPWKLSFLGRFDTIFFDGAIGPFLLVFIILAFLSAIKRLPQLSEYKIVNEVGTILLISAALFIFGSQQARFWLPSQFLLCIYAAPAVDKVSQWMINRTYAKLVIGLILSFVLIWNMWALGKQIVAVGFYKPVLGIEKELDFLKRVVPGYSAIEFINQNITGSARVLCVWTGAYGYYFNRPYYSDTLIEDRTIKKYFDESKNWADLKGTLKQNEFTHIFLRRSLLEGNLTQRQLEIFRSFLHNGTEELFREKDFSVLVILPSAPADRIKKED